MERCPGFLDLGVQDPGALDLGALNLGALDLIVLAQVLVQQQLFSDDSCCLDLNIFLLAYLCMFKNNLSESFDIYLTRMYKSYYLSDFFYRSFILDILMKKLF